MKEIIYLMPDANGTELVRSLAGYGVCPAGLRIVSGLELARIGLDNSGIAVSGKLISGSKQTAVIYKMMTENGFFEPSAYADAQPVSAAFDKLRHAADSSTVKARLLSDDALFSEKNKELTAALECYEQKLAEGGMTDSVSVMRLAAEKCAALDPEKYELAEVEEYPLTPLERELLDKLSGGRAKKLTLADIYGVRECDAKVTAVTEAYGASNEAEDIIGTIFREKLPLDKCVVAVTDAAKYSQLFSEICGRYGINVSMGCGTLIKSTCPARLLMLCAKWTDGITAYSIDKLNDMLFSDVFDRKKLWKNCFDGEYSGKVLHSAAEMMGNMRLGLDEDVNTARIAAYEAALKKHEDDDDFKAKLETLQNVKVLSAELGKGIQHIIAKYSVIRKNSSKPADTAAREKLSEKLGELEVDDITEILPQLTSGIVRSENSAGGSLYVTTIEKLACSMRPHVFIAGLSADCFPGAPAEDHLVLDCDCRLFGRDAIPTSAERTVRRREVLFDAVKLASALAEKFGGHSLRLSYYNYDLTALRAVNRSAALSKLIEGTEVRKAGFFSAMMSKSDVIGKAYIDGTLSAGKIRDTIQTNAVDLRGQKVFSPSDLDVFFKCPKHFLLEKIMGIYSRSSDDPMEVISLREQGIVLHKALELSSVCGLTDTDDIVKLGEELFDIFLLRRPPINKYAADTVRKEFAEMLKTAVQLAEDDKRVISREEEYSAEYFYDEDNGRISSGIKLKGYPDMVVEKSDGTCCIVDFKSGVVKKHKNNDIDTCLQTLLYAYMVEEQSGGSIKIDGCEYRYIRLEGGDRLVKCGYDSTIKRGLDDKMQILEHALKTGDFPCRPDKDSCKYCDLGGICGKENK